MAKHCIRTKVREATQVKHALANADGRIKNLGERKKIKLTAAQKRINAMTNWQRTRWERDGRKPRKTAHFLGLEHP